MTESRPDVSHASLRTVPLGRRAVLRGGVYWGGLAWLAAGPGARTSAWAQGIGSEPTGPHTLGQGGQPPAACATRMPIGMNLSWYARNKASDPVIFINQMKGAWPPAITTGEDVPFDAQGYPMALPATKGFAAIQILRRTTPDLEGRAPLMGRFRLYGRGTASLSLKHGQLNSYVFRHVMTSEMRKERLAHHRPGPRALWYIDFDMPSTGDGLNHLSLYIRQMVPRDYIRDLALVHHSHLELFRAGEVFAPEFLSDIEGYDVLRYMNWVGGNLYDRGIVNKDGQDWEAKQPMKRYVGVDHVTYNTGAAAWSLGPTHHGTVPIEHIIALSNRTRTSPWITLPVDMPDAQARLWAAAVRDGLEPELEVYWEYGNELFNRAWGFDGYRYALMKWRETYPDDSSEDMDAAAQWGATRGRALFDVIAHELGARTGQHYVAAGWAYQTPIRGDGSFANKGFFPAYFGAAADPGARVTDYSVALYYGWTLDEKQRDAAVMAQILARYGDDRARAEAMARWIGFGLDPDTRLELTPPKLLRPAPRRSWSEGLHIGVAQLIAKDVAAGLDPLRDLPQVLRLTGATLEYRGASARRWSPVLEFDAPPPWTLEQMIHEVQIVGHAHRGHLDRQIASGMTSGLRNCLEMRVKGHAAYAADKGLRLIAYEGGPHLQSPIPGAKGAYDLFADGPGVALLERWLAAAAAGGFELYMHFSSHRVHADNPHSLGLRRYTGQPEGEVPLDRLLKRLAQEARACPRA